MAKTHVQIPRWILGIFIYFFAFTVPPLVLGMLWTLSAVSEIYFPGDPTPLDSKYAPASPAPPHKPVALFLVSNLGTEVTDLLASWEILAESGIWDLRTVAPERKLSWMTGGLTLLPDIRLDQAPKPDLLVLPAVVDPDNPVLIQWVRENAPKAKAVLILGEALRLAARTGLLESRQVTTHFLAKEDIRQNFPNIRIQSSSLVHIDGKWISSSGMAASILAAQKAIELVRGKKTENGPRLDSGLSSHLGLPLSSPLNSTDALRLFLHGGFRWIRNNVGVLLYPGVSEISLASLLDTLPRTMSSRLVTVAEVRAPIQTRHGLMLAPTLAISDSPNVDLLVIPAGNREPDGPAVRNWLQQVQPPTKTFGHVAPEQAFDEALKLIESLENPGMSRFVQKMIQSSPSSEINKNTNNTASKIDIPLSLLLRPIWIGVIGVLIAWGLRRRL